MQCSRCSEKNVMAFRVEPTGEVCCISCLTQRDVKALGAQGVKSCSQCDNTESLWYVRQEDGSHLCLYCEQKRLHSQDKAWLEELDVLMGTQELPTVVRQEIAEDDDILAPPSEDAAGF